MKKSRNLVKFILLCLITVFIYAILFMKIDFLKVLVLLKSVDIRLLTLSILLSTLTNVFFAAYRWMKIIEGIGCCISFKEALFIKTGSGPMSFFLPLESGELIKAIYIKHRKKIGFEYGIGSILIDKIFNLFGILLILYIGLIFYGINLSPSSMVLPTVLLISKLSVNWQKVPIDFIKKMAVVLKAMSFNKKMMLLAYSVILQLSELITAYIIFKALRINIPFIMILIFIPIVVLISNIPVTISGLGTREAAIAFFFAGYGLQEKLLSAGILISFVEYVLPVMIGLFILMPFIERIYK